MTTTVNNNRNELDIGVDVTRNVRRQAAFGLAYDGSATRSAQLMANSQPRFYARQYDPDLSSSLTESLNELGNLRSRYLDLKRQWEMDVRTDELKTALEDVISQMIDRGWDL